MPLSLSENRDPSGLNAARLACSSCDPVFIITISDDQPPSIAYWGKTTAPGPPILVAICGTEAEGERLVSGKVLKLALLNRRPTAATGTSEERVNTPVRLFVADGRAENSCVTNCGVCCLAETVILLVPTDSPF